MITPNSFLKNLDLFRTNLHKMEWIGLNQIIIFLAWNTQTYLHKYIPTYKLYLFTYFLTSTFLLKNQVVLTLVLTKNIIICISFKFHSKIRIPSPIYSILCKFVRKKSRFFETEFWVMKWLIKSHTKTRVFYAQPTTLNNPMKHGEKKTRWRFTQNRTVRWSSVICHFFPMSM